VGGDGILGVALSGAGPSVLIFLDAQTPIKKATTAIAAHLERNNLSAELLATEITAEGASRGEDWRRKHRSSGRGN
jgi:homoserine kinase